MVNIINNVNGNITGNVVGNISGNTIINGNLTIVDSLGAVVNCDMTGENLVLSGTTVIRGNIITKESIINNNLKINGNITNNIYNAITNSNITLYGDIYTTIINNSIKNLTLNDNFNLVNINNIIQTNNINTINNSDTLFLSNINGYISIPGIITVNKLANLSNVSINGTIVANNSTFENITVSTLSTLGAMTLTGNTTTNTLSVSNTATMGNMFVTSLNNTTNSILSGNTSITGTLTVAGNTTFGGSIINIGMNGSIVNILGSINQTNITDVKINDILITLNKGGGVSSGCGFEIEENNSITGYIKTSSTRDSFLLKTPNASEETIVTKNVSNNINITGTVTANTITGAMTSNTIVYGNVTINGNGNNAINANLSYSSSTSPVYYNNSTNLFTYGSLTAGATGTTGVAGDTGPQGYNGTNGLTGIDGLNGAKGATGDMGPQGQTGPQGVAIIDSGQMWFNTNNFNYVMFNMSGTGTTYLVNAPATNNALYWQLVVTQTNQLLYGPRNTYGYGSDIRNKENIIIVDNTIYSDFINNIELKTFDFKGGDMNVTGLIADDLININKDIAHNYYFESEFYVNDIYENFSCNVNNDTIKIFMDNTKYNLKLTDWLKIKIIGHTIHEGIIIEINNNYIVLKIDQIIENINTIFINGRWVDNFKQLNFMGFIMSLIASMQNLNIKNNNLLNDISALNVDTYNLMTELSILENELSILETNLIK